MISSLLNSKSISADRDVKSEVSSQLCLKRVSQTRLTPAVLLTIAMVPMSAAIAGFPEAIQRGGRFCGRGYGDGYHACHSSGMRPLANLPPRTFPARVGTADEKVHGCPTCRPRALPGVDPISYRNPETFYHRFDRYAQAVSHQEAIQTGRLHKPIVDPEKSMAGGYSMLDPDGNGHERSGYGGNRFRMPYAGLNESGNSVLGATGEEPATPQISEDEMDEFREFQETKRLRNKFDKYLIDPKDTEPNQVIGGPPVGTEQRRKIDEAKVRALQEKLRRELAEEAAAKKAAQREVNRFNEDNLLSPSDNKPSDNLRSPSTLDIQEELPMPMDELLPPFPGSGSASPSSRELPQTPRPFPEPDRSRPGLERIPTPEPIAPGMGKSLDNFDSAKPEPLIQPDVEFNAPMQTQVNSEPSARVAEIPPAWRFVKQPR